MAVVHAEDGMVCGGVAASRGSRISASSQRKASFHNILTGISFLYIRKKTNLILAWRINQFIIIVQPRARYKANKIEE